MESQHCDELKCAVNYNTFGREILSVSWLTNLQFLCISRTNSRAVWKRITFSVNLRCFAIHFIGGMYACSSSIPYRNLCTKDCKKESAQRKKFKVFGAIFIPTVESNENFTEQNISRWLLLLLFSLLLEWLLLCSFKWYLHKYVERSQCQASTRHTMTIHKTAEHKGEQE